MANLANTLCLMLVLVAVSGCEKERIMKFERIEYLVGELAEAPQEFDIEATGLSRYISHTNESTPKLPEIGIYETMLSDSDIQWLTGALTNPPFASLPDHSGRIPSGSGYRFVRVFSESQAIDKKVGAEEPINPDLRKIINWLDQTIIKVAQHPKEVLRIELTQTGFNSEHMLTAIFVMSNPGVRSISCRDPQALLSASNGWLSAHLWSDQPDAKDMMSIKVKHIEVVSSVRELQGDKSVLVIPPKSSASFRIRVTVPIEESGMYFCRLSYANFAKRIADSNLIVGELLTNPVKTAVP